MIKPMRIRDDLYRAGRRIFRCLRPVMAFLPPELHSIYLLLDGAIKFGQSIRNTYRLCKLIRRVQLVYDIHHDWMKNLLKANLRLGVRYLPSGYQSLYIVVEEALNTGRSIRDTHRLYNLTRHGELNYDDHHGMMEDLLVNNMGTVADYVAERHVHHRY
jgi:hypothetical protein